MGYLKSEKRIPDLSDIFSLGFGDFPSGRVLLHCHPILLHLPRLSNNVAHGKWLVGCKSLEKPVVVGSRPAHLGKKASPAPQPTYCTVRVVCCPRALIYFRHPGASRLFACK